MSLHRLRGSLLRLGTGRHMPTCPDRLQAMQAPVQAALQQTPSAQMFDTQSAPATQPAPLGFLGLAPQLLFMHTAVETQSLATVQLLRQCGPFATSQLKGAHATGTAA